MLTSWNDLFALLENKQEAQADSEIALYVIPKQEFALKKKFRNSFLQNVLYTVCNSDISFEHAKDALDTMEYILIAMKKDISQLYGIAFVQIRSYDVFIQDNASICYNVFGVELEPQPSICSVCYVSLICSFPKSKCGQKILSYLERRGYADFKCDAIALHSIPERYSYYVSLGFYRTNNLASIYPVFKSNNVPIFNNSGGVSQIRNRFSSESPKYVFFRGEYNYMFQSYQYLFMKPCQKFMGGGKQLKTHLNAKIRSVQETVRQRMLCRRPVSKCV